MESSLIRYPELLLWNHAAAVARKQDYLFSMRCEEYFKEQVKVGMSTNKIGLYEFAERIEEARGNIERLVNAMIAEEAKTDPKSRLLHDSTMFNVLYKNRLCPGLWPLC